MGGFRWNGKVLIFEVLLWYTMETIPAKITGRLEQEMDELIKEGWFANRSELIRTAVRELVRRTRLEQLESAVAEDIAWGLQR